MGIICNAMGIPPRDEAAIREITSLKAQFFKIDGGCLYEDFHTVGGNGRPGMVPVNQDGAPKVVVTYRQYLTGADFLVWVRGPSGVVDRCVKAMVRPKRMLWLGRACCIPSRPILEAVFDKKEDAVQYLEGHGVEKGKTEYEGDVDRAEDATDALMVTPVCFHAFDGYRRRLVRRGIWTGEAA
jgi:CRISPR system Cascade subunit CasD